MDLIRSRIKFKLVRLLQVLSLPYRVALQVLSLPRTHHRGTPTPPLYIRYVRFRALRDFELPLVVPPPPPPYLLGTPPPPPPY